MAEKSDKMTLWKIIHTVENNTQSGENNTQYRENKNKNTRRKSGTIIVYNIVTWRHHEQKL